MLHRLTDAILGLSGTPVYAFVFLLAFLEAAAFIGFLVPGELAVLLGGVLAFQGKVSLPLIALTAIVGAVAGDSAGYAIGRRWGHRLLETRLGRRIARPKHLERARDLIARRGGLSIVLGRFAAVLRVLVPGLAGMTEMPYRVFFFYNLIGGILWAGGMTLVGYLAGNAWRTVEKYSARASALLAVLLFVAVLLVWAARWAIRNEDLLRARWKQLLERPRVAAFNKRFDRQIAWGFERFKPAGLFGLYLTLGIGLTLSLFWALGAALQDLISGEELLLIDHPVGRFVATHRGGRVTELMKLLTHLGSSRVVLTVLVVVAAITVHRLRRIEPAVFLAGVVGLGIALERVLQFLVNRAGPASSLVPSEPSSFPSAHTAAAVTLFGGIALIVLKEGGRLAAKVWVAALAVLAILVVGTSRVYLGANYASDVVAGMALGGSVLALCGTLWLLWDKLGGTSELRSLRAQTAKRLLSFAFIAGSLGLAIHLVLLSAPGIHQSVGVVRRLNPSLIVAAVVLEAGSNLALARLYRASITSFDRDIGFGPALRVSMSMFTLARILPAGGAAAAVFGAAQLTELGVGALSAATSVVVAGVLGMVTLAGLVGLGAAGALLRGDLPTGYIAAAVVLLGTVGMFGYIAYRVSGRVSAMNGVLDKLSSMLERIGRTPNLDRARAIIQKISDKRPTLAQLKPMFLWSALNWLLDAAVLWLVFFALGYRLHLGVLLVGYGVANIATALPITPGGLGFVEAGMSSVFTAFGVPGATAVIGVLGYRLISFWLPVLAGVPQYLALSRKKEAAVSTVTAA